MKNPDLYLAHIQECLAKVQAHIQTIRDELASQNRIGPPPA